MVSVESPEESSAVVVSAQLSVLRRRILEANHPGDLNGLFAYHVLHDLDVANVSWNVAPQSSHYNRSAVNGNAPHAAMLAFSLTHFPDQAPPNALDQLIPNLSAITHRKLYPNDRLAFLHDERIVVGLGLAAPIVEQALPGFGVWLHQALTDPRLEVQTTFTTLIHQHVVRTLGHDTSKPLAPVELAHLHTAPELAAVQWMTDHGTAALAGSKPYRLQREVIRSALGTDAAAVTVTQAALLYAGINRGLDLVADEITISREHLGVILRRFEPAMRRWRYDPPGSKTRVTWEIPNEREVQSILYLTLQSAFGDVIDEDTLPKFGHASYRADFGIPRLGIIVEVKYARAATDFRGLEKEVMEDSVGYFQQTNGRYRDLIIFIYDASSSVQEHRLAEATIRRIPHVTDVIIVSRPSQIPGPPAKMKRTPTKSTRGAVKINP